jgi:predicted alpha-1,6-mannanase (GH76 family)
MLERYWQPGAGALGGYASSVATGSVPAGPVFYDDNEWIALDLVRAYSLTGSRPVLARARALFELVASGWGADEAACPGGVYWMRSAANRDRNAVTTENGALLAVQLYALTGGLQYLRWARRMVAWSDRCLARADGLLADHVGADGTRAEQPWSYNQGAFIAAAVLLARATGDDRYLDRAARRAAAALAHFGSFAGEPPIFVAIFFRDLALLDEVRPQPGYRQALVRYASAAWVRGRDPAAGLFAAQGQPTLLDQAAMVQIYALLAGSQLP